MNGLSRRPYLGIGVLIGGCVVVAVVVGKVAAGDVQSDSMVGQKSIRHRAMGGSERRDPGVDLRVCLDVPDQWQAIRYKKGCQVNV